MSNHIVYGFLTEELPIPYNGSKSMYVRPASKGDEPIALYLCITMDAELHLVSPMGESPFMETHKDVFMDLINLDMVEFVEGDYD